MKKIMCAFLLGAFFAMTGCNFKEEAISEVREAICEEAEISFTLNGLWSQSEEEENRLQKGQMLVFTAWEEETGSAIDIICEDLTETAGGTLVRMDDYVSGIREQLENSSEHQYSCSDTSVEKIYGKEYVTFQAEIPGMEGKQKFFIRRQENTMVMMVISAFGEEKIEDILALGKEM